MSSTSYPAFSSPESEARYRTAYDAVLRAWPMDYQELDVPTRYGATHVIASGPESAPALVLLPSFAGSATLWRPNVAALSAVYRTYAVDTPGQAGKSVQTRAFANAQDLADWLSDLLDGLGVARASLVGASYGGFLALNQALRAPERVRRVALISPAGVFVGGLLWAFLRARIARWLRGQRRRGIADLLGPDATLHVDDEAWAALMAVVMSDSARPNLIAPPVFDTAELATIRAPTLLLIGERETLYPARKTLRRALARMPGLSGEVIPGAHHLAALAKPDEVNRLLLSFLQASG
ncbi:alpha/beta fold hydrolase [Lysobacter sp. Root604]|uniref:alpha/beta fold hydrolase n=1 Tax=Lysobacter sp. Root604 TaxID=1736568 RepID=UPI0006FCC404|nr:alpha/beta fold hydrolase [Lysobacter sp. Root604]KRA17401.1 hypothetical protein ASD69_11955 [Lysobacter sp. Root604]